MGDIRYVCLSDLHLGQDNSLLTNLETASPKPKPLAPSPVLAALTKGLRDLILTNSEGAPKPMLILNGDILEMALTSTNQAAMVFERFMELAAPANGETLFDKIIYVPGNHDHHLWETARETQYVNFISANRQPYLEKPWHVTNMFVENSDKPVPSYFLTNLIKSCPGIQSIDINVAYPNFGLITEEGDKCVIFHHGHFIESIYQLMSEFMSLVFPDRKKPHLVWDIETENFAWIDFFWSSMGRSGGAGRKVEAIYESLDNEKARKRLISNLASSLAENYDLPGWGDWMEEKLLNGLLQQVAEKIVAREKSHPDGVLGPDAQTGLWKYMEQPLLNQLKMELNKNEPPPNVTLVFGHTHKPYQESADFEGFPGWVNVYNTGGWVVETVDPEPLHGASVVLLDDQLNATSLRLYNEASATDGDAVFLEQATKVDASEKAFHDQIKARVDPSQETWANFSTAVADAVRIRAQHLKARLARIAGH